MSEVIQDFSARELKTVSPLQQQHQSLSPMDLLSDKSHMVQTKATSKVEAYSTLSPQFCLTGASSVDARLSGDSLNHSAQNRVPSFPDAVANLGSQIGDACRQHPFISTAALLTLPAIANPEVRTAITEGAQFLSRRASFSATEALNCLTNAPYKIRTFEWNAGSAMTGVARGSKTGDILVSARNAVAKLNCLDPVSGEEHCFGTAFAVSKDGRFLTNCHVVEDRPTCTLVDRFELPHKAVVLLRDKKNDLAVLQLENRLSYSSFKPLHLADGLPPGFSNEKNLLAFGHPHSRRNLFMSRSAKETVAWPEVKSAEDKGFAVVPLTTRPGNSGSPVIDQATGYVVGINRALPTDNNFNWKLSIVVPAERGKELLEKSWH